MTALALTGVVALGSIAAGLVGSLTGLGGGIIIVPMLTIGLGIDIRYAIGASLISVIATSSGAAAAYVKEGYSNIRLGMLLEVATTVGAIVGANLAGWISTDMIGIIFGLVLLYSAYRSFKRREDHIVVESTDPLAERLKLNSTFPTPRGKQPYAVQSVKAGFSMMFGAGIFSGLLGIGSGVFKVLAMDQAMRLPFKVSTTTSNFMIGVTAAASAGVYLHRGYIEPEIAFPVMLGVLFGATLGSKLLATADVKILRAFFSVVIIVLAVQMLYKGLMGAL